jgi:SnoaL-like domain
MESQLLVTHNSRHIIVPLFFLPLLLFASFSSAHTAHASECPILLSPPALPSPTPPSLLVQVYGDAPSKLHDTLNFELSIRNTLSIYPLAVDGKNFSAPNRVFTEDVIADFPEPTGVASGLANVEKILETALEAVSWQHLLGTQVIGLGWEGPCTAGTLTYFAASHFGKGDWKGQVRLYDRNLLGFLLM